MALSFYYADKGYVDHLRQYDAKVPSLDYDAHDKFFCGIVLNVNDYQYYAPISHDTQKRQTSMIIRDRNRPIASIKFSFMIPIIGQYLTRINFDEIARNDLNYANLLRAEYEFCSAHRNDIYRKAQAVYRIGMDEKHFLHPYCCNFKTLERHTNDYNRNNVL